MVIIEYTRFVLEPDTEVTLFQGQFKIKKVLYHKEFDHSDILKDHQFQMEKAQTAIEAWEHDHYGYATITTIQDESETTTTITNLPKFFQDMSALGILVEEHK